MQQLHPDFSTQLPSTEYFFLGSGKAMAAIQWSSHDKATPLGLLLMDPKHFGRKWSTHLFHPEFGLERTQITVHIDGIAYRPDHKSLRVSWDSGCVEPQVKATWTAGPCRVIELFRAPWDEPFIVREVYVLSAANRKVEIEAALYATPSIYNWFSQEENALTASGYQKLTLRSLSEAVTNERFIRVSHGGSQDVPRAVFVYALGSQSQTPRNFSQLLTPLKKEEDYWSTVSSVVSSLPLEKTATPDSPITGRFAHAVEDLFKASCAGLRAAVATDGRFDASIFQYNFEWSGDAAMVAMALVYSGQFEVARRVLVNILTRLSTSDGMTAESSRFRGGKDSELNNNGEILKACWTYYEWSGDSSLLREHFMRIASIADYLLRPEYFDDLGMLRASRDIWERMEAMGIQHGYDVSHQTFAILGLSAAANIAELIGNSDASIRWRQASDKIRTTFLEHPTHSFIENGRIIKRRLIGGEMQYQVRVDHSKASEDYFKKFVPAGMPLGNEGFAIWEPDVSECFPICFGIVDPTSDIATRTMNVLESLWSQDWEGGGYGRYNVLSEPDSPGPWPFATGYMAAAYLETGDMSKALRAIEWLVQKARSGGSWLEFYGNRPTPPLPPTGIIVWGWAQFITLVVRHMLGAKVVNGNLEFAPRVEGWNAQLRFWDARVSNESQSLAH